MKPILQMIPALLAALVVGHHARAGEQNTQAGQHDPLTGAILETRADIEDDTRELNRIREEIASKRRPLTQELATLQRTVREKKEDLARLQRRQTRLQDEKRSVAAEIAQLAEQCKFVVTVFSDYRRAMETRANVAGGTALAAKLRDIDEDLVDTDDFAALPDGLRELLATSSAWNQSRLGGKTLEGTALDRQGVEHRGTFAMFGPLAYFAAGGNGVAGLAVPQFGGMRPTIFEPEGRGTGAAIAALVGGHEASVPVDVTDGDAIKIARSETGIIAHVRKGGFVMVPLLAVGLLAAVLVVWKAVELSRIRSDPGDAVTDVAARLEAGDVSGAEARARALREPLASLLAEAIEHRNSSRADLEEIMHEHVLSAVPRLERYLGALAVFGGVAPLLGLLGTVTGMIHTFRLVTVFGTGDAKLLSGGISEALVTTEFGLAIAIPVLLVHAYYARRVRGIIGSLEQTAVSMVNQIARHRDTSEGSA